MTAMFGILICGSVYAEETQRFLVQDVTINPDGSMLVREAIWLDGSYNGAKRELRYCDYSTDPFIGLYGSFSGICDIYDGSGIDHIRVFAIPQSDFDPDVLSYERTEEFKEVKKAVKGQYGVYTNKYNDLMIYCPSGKEKVISIEYTVNDAVVVHNDIAELYWCFLDNRDKEKIIDYRLNVHLPQNDAEFKVWSHGSDSALCRKVDNRTVMLNDTDVGTDRYETVRIMFDRSMVPDAVKMSGVDGIDNIVRYETAMADPETAEMERELVNAELALSYRISNLRRSKDIENFNYAQELLQNEILDSDVRARFRIEIDGYKEEVNENWKKTLETKYKRLTSDFIMQDDSEYRSQLGGLRRWIDYGFDEAVKQEYLEKIEKLEQQKAAAEMNRSRKCKTAASIIFGIQILICIAFLFDRMLERFTCGSRFCPDYPYNEKGYVLDYLKTGKVTGRTLGLAILELAADDIITISENPEDKDDFLIILKGSIKGRTDAEKAAVKVLFYGLREEKHRSVKMFKRYNRKLRSYRPYCKVRKRFIDCAEKECLRREYFNSSKKTVLRVIMTILLSFAAIALIILAAYIQFGSESEAAVYFLSVLLLLVLGLVLVFQYRGRTKKGRLEYSELLGFRRYLVRCVRTGNDHPALLGNRMIVIAPVLGLSERFLRGLNITVPPERMHGEDIIVRRYDWCYRELGNVSMHIPASSSGNSDSGSFGGSSSDSGAGTGGGGGGWSRF